MLVTLEPADSLFGILDFHMGVLAVAECCHAEIQRLADQIDFDPETGEILCDADAIFEQIDALKMERQSILEYLAKLVLNIRAEAAALKDEEARLKNRRLSLDLKENRLMKVLDRECSGKKTDLGVATFNYRQNSHVEVSDAEKAIRWLEKQDQGLFLMMADAIWEVNQTLDAERSGPYVRR
mgnify:CR=1 FL=1